MVDLTGGRAVVCGSTQGIGRACAEVLAGQGASVVLVARDQGRLQEVANSLDTRAGQTHAWVCADFSNPQSVRDKVAEHVAEHGPAEILVNNTGGPASGPIFDAKVEDFLAGFTQHILCNQLLVQTLAPGMKERNYGRIINIISTSVKQPIPGLGVSNTIRAAVANWARTLAGELGPYGITVNNILPGYTDTARLGSLILEKANRQETSREEIERKMKAHIPMGRFATPDEIAYAVAFLASKQACYISGTSIPVDGGRTSSS